MSHLISTIGNVLSGGAASNAQAGAAAADPFASQRPQYQTMLSDLLKDPSSVTKTPGYQFNFDQGMTALQRQEAATGNLNSGTADIGAVEFGQNYAMNTFNQYENMLAHLAGADIGSPGTAGSLLTKGLDTAGQSGINAIFGNMIGSGGSGGGGGGGGTPGLMQLLMNG